MSDLAALLSEPFAQRAIVAALLASLVCGPLGTFLVLRRLSFLAGGLSHAAFGGIGLCHFLGLPPALGGLLTVSVAGLLLGPIPQRQARAQDALIGVLWASGMAAGVLFIHLTPGYPPDLGAFLFGNVLLVATTDLWLLAGFALVTLLLLRLFYHQLVALTFDETFAAVQGVPVRLLSTGLLLLLGAAVVALLPVVGLLLVLALLTVPSLISLELLDDLGPVLVASIAVAALITVGGLGLSFAWDLPSGPAIILLGVALLALTHGGKALLRRRGS